MSHHRALATIVALILLVGMVAPVAAQSEVVVTTTDNAQLRSGPGRENGSLGVVPYNTTISATGRNKDGSWVQVNYNGTAGWIATFLLSWTGTLDTLPVGGVVAATPQQPVVAGGPVSATNQNVLNVRAAPSSNSAQLGQLAAGTTISLNGRWGSGNSMWVRFDYNGQPAWAAGWLLSINGDVNALLDIEAAQNAVLGLCAGGNAPEAAPYSGGAGLHPIILLNDTGGRHAWDSQIGNWGAGRTPGSAELVGCVSPEQQVSIETCLYNGPSITRYIYRVDVRLIAAQTGQVITSTPLTGSFPRECRFQEPYNLTVLSGGHVSLDQLREWLRPYVNP